ncbi:MAG: galactose-1-phosphate uridylyltransferase [Nevskiales bacterium]
MPELRQNRFTKEWVIIATERAKRPDQMIAKRDVKPLDKYSANCPFCPGNEAQAPPEVARHPADGAWQVRVVPNKFAALSREGQPVRTIHRSRRSINGVGIHEVIAETPDHSSTLALLPEAHVAEVVRMYKDRFQSAHCDPRVAHVILFKNHGSQAGASLEHPHSQMIATPVISSQVRMRMHEAMRHYDEFGECGFCQVIEEELEEKTRIVLASEYFVVMEPYASGSPFATHIYPRFHMATFGEINDAEVLDLGRVLKTVLAKLYWGLENPDFNFTIRTAPPETAGEKHYHWYISLIPRLTKVAGFELGSGMFINVVLPESAAEFLRNVDVSKRA